MKKLIGVFSLFVITQLVAGFNCNATQIMQFSNGLACIRHTKPVKEGNTTYHETDTYSVIDYNGVTIVPPHEYDWIGSYCNGLAICKKNNKYGYLNTRGELVIPAIYDAVNIFGGDYALVRKGEFEDARFFTINKRGNIVYEFPGHLNLGFQDYVLPFETNTGFFVFATKGEGNPGENKWFLINHKGKHVTEAIYDNPYAYDCDESGYPDYVSNSADKSAVIVQIAAKHDDDGNLIEDNKMGAIDNRGVKILPLAYYDIIPVGATLSALRNEDDMDNPECWERFILNGKKVELPDRYILPRNFSDPTEPYILVYAKDTKRLGIIDQFHQPLTEFEYFEISAPDKYGICVGKKGTCRDEEEWWNKYSYKEEEVDVISLSDSPEIIHQLPTGNYRGYNDGMLLVYSSDEKKYELWDVVTRERLYKLNKYPEYFDRQVSVVEEKVPGSLDEVINVRNRSGLVVYSISKGY